MFGERARFSLSFAAGWAESESVEGRLAFEAGDSDRSKLTLVLFIALPLNLALGEGLARIGVSEESPADPMASFL